ncbi:MAG: YggS family pyridoxal phosphate-dependent enzyme [Fimbriimonadaceae bacterium]|nr:YggS family pyridoxal phosphate-dependent enzyme [Fimbriimonadaceae bacterium]
MSLSYEELKLNLRDIQERIRSAAGSVNRNPEDIKLIAVTKTVPIETIQLAYDLGLRTFGESRLQEALPKIEALPKDIDWHFIGKLQSNKLRRAASDFSVFHTIESESQLKELTKLDRKIDVLVEVNIANEVQKSGISLENLEIFVKRVLECTQANFRGLMAIGPNEKNPEAMRPFFKKLRLEGKRFGSEWLSIGMSGDFEVAIQEGSTHVRVGSALFGPRN